MILGRLKVLHQGNKEQQSTGTIYHLRSQETCAVQPRKKRIQQNMLATILHNPT